MKKVITYGTFDLLHYGHVRLLERAKALGDYLIVGVTSDAYDKSRGKINVRQSLNERMQAVRETGLADEIIVEEYEGQKIDDIRKYDVDIFAIGSDWEGTFDYLSEYCQVVYLPRTEGVSSSQLRSEDSVLSLGLAGVSTNVEKVAKECAFVNGIEVSGNAKGNGPEYEALLAASDAVYIFAPPEEKAAMIRLALENGKHVLAEAPILADTAVYEELSALAREKDLVLMEALKTAFSMAYRRLILMLKGGKIGRIVSVDAACTSMQEMADPAARNGLGSLHDWGPTAMLPVFQLLGTSYRSKQLYMMPDPENPDQDAFTRLDFVYENAVSSLRVGKGVKSEGELVITGTKGCAYVPAPWWKTDFFEIRYENPEENQRFFYQLEGEGIRYELKAFLDAVSGRGTVDGIEPEVTEAMIRVMEDAGKGRDLVLLSEEG